MAKYHLDSNKDSNTLTLKMEEKICTEKRSFFELLSVDLACKKGK
jgi:hypothetical protein